VPRGADGTRRAGWHHPHGGPGLWNLPPSLAAHGGSLARGQVSVMGGGCDLCRSPPGNRVGVPRERGHKSEGGYAGVYWKPLRCTRTREPPHAARRGQSREDVPGPRGSGSRPRPARGCAAGGASACTFSSASSTAATDPRQEPGSVKGTGSAVVEGRHSARRCKSAPRPPGVAFLRAASRSPMRTAKTISRSVAPRTACARRSTATRRAGPRTPRTVPVPTTPETLIRRNCVM
jgi:hypothetical protein